jgi:hypothetical protein
VRKNKRKTTHLFMPDPAYIEVCNCEVLCPCWIGEDPDYGTCEASVAYHFDKGEIDGVDVSGLTETGEFVSLLTTMPPKSRKWPC